MAAGGARGTGGQAWLLFLPFGARVGYLLCCVLRMVKLFSQLAGITKEAAHRAEGLALDSPVGWSYAKLRVQKPLGLTLLLGLCGCGPRRLCCPLPFCSAPCAQQMWTEKQIWDQP